MRMTDIMGLNGDSFFDKVEDGNMENDWVTKTSKKKSRGSLAVFMNNYNEEIATLRHTKDFKADSMSFNSNFESSVNNSKEDSDWGTFTVSEDNSGSLQGIEKEERDRLVKKKMVQDEFMDTEAQYVENLSVFVKYFARPLKIGGYGLSKPDAEILFSNIDVIEAFHVLMLRKLQSTDNIASVILKHADFLKVYTRYINSYDLSVEVLEENSKNSTFQQFLECQKLNPACKKREFSSFLIMPVQRIPRYELLFREMLSFSKPCDEDYSHLELAYEKIKAIATRINEEIRKLDDMAELLELSNKLSGGPKGFTLFKKGRSIQSMNTLSNISNEFVEETQCKQLQNGAFNTQVSKAVMVYLLSDSVLVTSQSYKVRVFYHLDRMATVENPCSPQSLLLTNGDDGITLYFPTIWIKKEWLAAILKSQESFYS